MCGIAGVLLLANSSSPLPASGLAATLSADGGEGMRRTLLDMAEAIAHRGPDGWGTHVDLPAGLAHRRLSIIDLSTGGQPMLLEHLAVTFNGEIYNYRELRAELQGLGHSFATTSDTEALLHAWLEWGVDCLPRLEGMFAFAIWDRRTRSLHCARDRFGKKPFFYLRQADCFAFASELSALERLPGFRPEVDVATLARFLAYEYVPTPESIYRQVRKLRPGHCLEIREDGTFLEEAWWRLPRPLPEGTKGFARADEPALAEELRRLLTQAVARRLVADVPVGVFLSGGVDSSAVAWTAARLAPGIKTFSIGFQEASYDESRFAAMVARQIGTDHQLEMLSAEACADLLPDIVRDFDEPMADPSIVPTWLLARMTRRQVTVALGGDGPDELMAGYEYFPAFRATLPLDRLPAWGRAMALGLGRTVARMLPGAAGYVNPRAVAGTFLAAAAAPVWQRTQRMLTAWTPEMQQGLWTSLAPERAGAEALFAPTRELYQSRWDWPPLARIFAVFLHQYMLDYILVKVDRCTMLHGLEARAPFLDRDLAEFAARLPLEMKLRGNTRKYLLKRAMEPHLPREILHRPKRGFLIPTAAWLRTRLRPLVEDLLGEDHLRRQGLFQPRAVRALVEAHQSGRADHRKALWTLLVLQLWLARKRPTIVLG